MAVEARQHLSLFPPQISNRELAMNGVEANGNVFGTPIVYGMLNPSSATTTAAETVFPVYGSAITGGAPAKNAAMKSDSGLTYVPISRKRSRDSVLSSFPSAVQNQNANNRCGGSFTFLGEDLSFQIQQQQLEIDRFIAHHTEKVRIGIEERRKRYCRRIAAAVEESITKKMKIKEEEIERIGKLNWSLEERVKSLSIENQIWRDLAQTNEATANALRCNLEQVLAQRRRADEAALMDDAQSCCGSNSDEIDRRTLADSASNYARDRDYGNINGGRIAPSVVSNKMCRSCEREESCVLFLPCRHLCLCTFCGSSLHTCPVCNSTKTASVHVNLSS
ncbi:hypothetical protein BUALT_Bualt18G0082400 [Buddleja alternifolia]|uniref:RING-type domain-containing protein n=1 Tax=Buddleja alternifolia TaxID=168488 RepID=A0AAV6W9U9_9LAMI|nr:hypothetical protein BUALT_Bualt18G0082400 [Buddleja alternifolia]